MRKGNLERHKRVKTKFAPKVGSEDCTSLPAPQLLTIKFLGSLRFTSSSDLMARVEPRSQISARGSWIEASRTSAAAAAVGFGLSGVLPSQDRRAGTAWMDRFGQT